MNDDLIAKASIIIDVPASTVWDALINPAMIKQYLFGTEAVSDWKVGSSLIYKGEWEGKAYEDKGEIVVFEPEKQLSTTYWSSIAGLEDIPENYKKVDYTLASAGEGKTELTITQDNNKTEESKEHSQKNWETVLQGMKKLLESK